MNHYPQECFTKYEPYTIHMRSSEHAPSRHTRYLASLVSDHKTGADRIEAEEAVLEEGLVISPVQESITVMDLEAEAASSEVEEISKSDFEEAAAASEADDTMAEEDELPAEISKSMEKKIRLHQAADYLKTRWGPDVTKYVPARSQYARGRQLDLEKWPGGAVEELAQLAMLTTDSSKRRQALEIIEQNVQKRMKNVKKEVFKIDVTNTIRRFSVLPGTPTANVDGYVPLEEDEGETAEQHFEVVDPDTLSMGLKTLRVELTKERQKVRLALQVLAES